MILRNVSPLGDVGVDGYGIIPAGDQFTVNGSVDGLIGQVENFEPVDDEAKAARHEYLDAHAPTAPPSLPTAVDVPPPVHVPTPAEVAAVQAAEAALVAAESAAGETVPPVTTSEVSS